MARPDRFTPPPGCVVIRLDDLAALLAARAPGSEPQPPKHVASASWPALAAAVGVLTARLNDDPKVTAAELAPDVPEGAVAAAALVIAAGTLSVFLPDRGRGLLKDLGLLAASEGAVNPNGETP